MVPPHRRRGRAPHVAPSVPPRPRRRVAGDGRDRSRPRDCRRLRRPSASASPTAATRTVDVQLLGINDFHGHIQASTPGCITVPGSTASVAACRNRVGQVPAGGAAYLSTHLDQLQADNPHGTIRVASGDLIGASPLVSGIFHDEPAIEALNAMGLQLSAPGNHEWDEGLDELMRMLDGGCHPVDGCFPTPDGEPFAGADFPYVASNIFSKGTHRLVLPPFVIKRVKGQPIAFIGADLEETPTIVLPSGVADVDFVDESTEINKWSKLLARFGVRSQVVVFHQGSSQVEPGSINECKGGLAPGPFVDEVTDMSSEIDVVMSGHSHQAYVCDLAGKKVISGSSFGRLISDVDLQIDRRTHQVTSVSARNVPVTQDVPVDPDVQRIVDFYTAQSAPIANRVVGSITGDLTTTTTPSGEQAMGEVVADSQLAATATTGDAVVAFMNPGGVRSSILYADSAGGEQARAGHVRRALHGPAVRQQPRHAEPDRRPDQGDARAAVVGHQRHRTEGPAPVRGLHLLVERVGTGGQQGGRRLDDDRRRSCRAHRHLSGDGEQLPRRGRRQLRGST